MTPKQIISLVICLAFAVAFIAVSGSLFQYNDLQDWQILQGVTGKVSVIEGSGYYGQWFGKPYRYPKTLEAFYSSHPEEGNGKDDSIKVTFNDGGTAQVSAFVKIGLPLDEQKRILLHQDFQGNYQTIKSAVRAHLVNAIKASGPMMSASENQSSRKSEFNQIVEEQLINGLFRMRRTEVELADLTETVEAGTDDKGNRVTKERKAKVLATEIVKDKDGKPIIDYKSPLERYGITVIQFSITEIEYDNKTLEQFAAKKESYLNAEKSKAQRQEEVQQRLMIEEKGRRQVAEIEAVQNQKKTEMIIQAEMNQEVAEVKKKQAVTEAQQKVEVAKQQQQETETMKAIAKIKVETATLEKQALIAAAEAKQKTIELGGGISEKERVLAEFRMNRDIGVAKELSRIAVPGIIIGGGKDGGGNVTQDLMQYSLMRNMGLFDIKANQAVGEPAVTK